MDVNSSLLIKTVQRYGSDDTSKGFRVRERAHFSTVLYTAVGWSPQLTVLAVGTQQTHGLLGYRVGYHSILRSYGEAFNRTRERAHNVHPWFDRHDRPWGQRHHRIHGSYRASL